MILRRSARPMPTTRYAVTANQIDLRFAALPEYMNMLRFVIV
jgi:hypothetical protein